MPQVGRLERLLVAIRIDAMYEYILVDIATVGSAYQVVLDGRVVQYVDGSGAYLFDTVPTGLSSCVVDAAPSRLTWMN